MIFSVKKKNGFWGILGPTSYGIGATFRIGPEMLCLQYAGFLMLLWHSYVPKIQFYLMIFSLVNKTSTFITLIESCN